MQNNSSLSSFVFRRSAAFLYDSFLLIAIFFVVTSIAIALNKGQAIENHALKLVFFPVLYGVGFLFFSWFWRHGGQTLGMQAWRIKVINETNDPISYKQCAIRYLTGTFLFGITIVVALFRKSGQGLHDTWSGTKIVFKNKELEKK